MKAKVLQISWHVADENQKPVLSVHFQPVINNDVNNNFLFATSGADNDVRIWMYKDDGTIEYRTSIYHTHEQTTIKDPACINVVRFSPCGRMVAFCGDKNKMVYVWRKSDKQSAHAEDKEAWESLHACIAGHENLYDLAWSPDSLYIVCVAIDGATMVIDLTLMKVFVVNDHKHAVQGVAFDPLGRYFVTQSSDRTCRVYEKIAAGAKMPFKCVSIISKIAIENEVIVVEEEEEVVQEKKEDDGAGVGGVADDAMVIDLEINNNNNNNNNNDNNANNNKKKEQKTITNQGIRIYRMFQDENLSSFFRRPCWSPDGTLMVVPAGLHHNSSTAYIFSRYDLTRPIIVLPTPHSNKGKPVIAIRFSPLLYIHREGTITDNLVLDLEYRMMFAVATTDTVIIYDTAAMHGLASASDLHPTNITDLDWLPNGKGLVISSSDGYCSTIALSDAEVGCVLPLEEYPQQLRDAKKIMRENNDKVYNFLAEHKKSQPPPQEQKSMQQQQLLILQLKKEQELLQPQDGGAGVGVGSGVGVGGAASADVGGVVADGQPPPQKKARKIIPVLTGPPTMV